MQNITTMVSPIMQNTAEKLEWSGANKQVL